MVDQQTFAAALESWRAAQIEASAKRLEYERIYSSALSSAPGGNREVREAHASIIASTARLNYELAQIEAKAQEHWVMFLRVPRAVHGPELGAPAEGFPS